jgi:hypothetical protein
MIEDREVWCDVCARHFASVPPEVTPPAYTPLDFCPGCAVPAVALVRVWGALPDGEAARLAAKWVELANGGSYEDSEWERVSGTLWGLAAEANGHLKDAVRQGALAARELFLTELPVPGVDWVLQLIDSADWSLTARLAELAPFLARLEPHERHSLDDSLMQCLDLVREADPGVGVDACAGATRALMETVFRVVAFTFMSERGTWIEEEHWTGEHHLAAEFGITRGTMHRILEAMLGYGLVQGR